MALPTSTSQPTKPPLRSPVPLTADTDDPHRSIKKKKKNKRKNKGTSSVKAKPFLHFSRFPEGIQQRIFEYAYHQGYVSGPVLALVSHKINKWIEPLIYEYIIIDRFDRISHRPDRLWRTFSNSAKTQDFFKSHVKGILVNGSVDPVVTDLLTVCTDISSFSCYAQGALTETILEKLASIFSTQEFPQLRRLSLSGLGLDEHDIKRPFFQNLTHLAVDIGDDYQSFPWKELKAHPLLTHILIDVQFELHDKAPQEFKLMVLDILSNAPLTLRCLVVLVDWDRLYESSFQQKCDRSLFSEVINGKVDERVVVAGYTGDREEIDVTVVGEHPAQFLEYVGYVALTPDHAVPWVCPPNSFRRDVWERAEDVLQQRQANT